MNDVTPKLVAVKGMPDILPEQSLAWQHVEQVIRNLMHSYAYQEIRTPLLERTQLFKRSIGEVTDIVEKEMYTFLDQNGEQISVRPEGTAGCVRACIEHSLLRNQQQHRLWYLGTMCRYERPQKGRYRQFSQFAVEAFNLPGIDIEVEQLAICARLWQNLGIAPLLSLQINSLGDALSRAKHKQDLVAYFTAQQAKLDEDSKRRLTSNPLRILDSKNPEMQDLIHYAPQLLDYLDQEAAQEFTDLQQRLSDLGIKYTINPRLVRGLDYYNRTVYEWVTDSLGAQATVCGGGRYDKLVEMLGGPATPAVGFALGMERVLLLVASIQPELSFAPDGYLICIGQQAAAKSLELAEQIRDRLPKFALSTHLGSGSFANLFKKADKSGAKVALIVGDDELATNSVGIKFLRMDRPQQTVAMDKIYSILGEV